MKLCNPRYHCYAEFSQNDGRYEMGQRKWFIGSVLFLGFSPCFYLLWTKPELLKAPIWVGYLVLGIIFLTGVVCIGFYRKAFFDKSSGLFHYERGFFVPYTRVDGGLGEIEYVDLYTYVSRDGSNTFHHKKLSIRYRNRNLVLADDGSGTNPSEARKLAALIGCEMKLTGRKDIWGVEGKGDYKESPEEVRERQRMTKDD